MQTSDQYNNLLREKDAAAFLNVSPAWLQRSRCYGGGPDFVRYGRAVRYEPACLRAWVEQHRVAGEKGVN